MSGMMRQPKPAARKLRHAKFVGTRLAKAFAKGAWHEMKAASDKGRRQEHWRAKARKLAKGA